MKTEILSINSSSLAAAVDVIKNNGLVAFPTETVYGLGGCAFSDEAISKIFQAKGRPGDNPLIAHVCEGYDINQLVEIEHQYVYDLIEAFCPGPLTLVCKSRGTVSSLVSCGLDTLAVRIPAHKGAQQFLNAVNCPIAAPSANTSKHVSPVSAQHVFDDLEGKIPMILDGGRCIGGIESTVLDVTSLSPRILRSGLITQGMISAVVGSCEYAQHKDGDKVKSPGVKYSHYTPYCQTAYYGREDIAASINEYNKAVMSGKKPVFLCDDKIQGMLCDYNTISLGGTSEEYARNVYNALREAEKKYDTIIGIEVRGDNQIDVGVLNRFIKACSKK